MSQDNQARYRGPVIDSHVHLIDLAKARIDWVSDVPSLNRGFSIADFDAASAGIDVRSMVFLEVDVAPGLHLDEARWVASLAEEDTRLAAIVPHAPLELGMAVAGDLQLFKDLGTVRGVRRLLQGEADPAFCLQDEFLAGVRLLPRYDMHFEICILHHQIEPAASLVERCPDVMFVLNHIAKPGIKDGLIDAWQTGMKRLAARPNVVCKFSGMVTEADHGNWSIEDLRPYADHVIQAFGPDRLMFGGDWPVVTLASSYGRWFDTASELLSDLSDDEKQRVFHDNAAAVYRIQTTASTATKHNEGRP